MGSLNRGYRLNEYCSLAGDLLRGEEQISADSTHENSLEGLDIIKLIFDQTVFILNY